MATSKIQVTEGSGKNVATNSFSEDAVTKEAQRIVLNTSAGAETGVAANPIQVSLANHGTNATAVKVDGSGVTQPVSGNVGITGSVAVTGTFYQATQPVSLASAITPYALSASLISGATSDITGTTSTQVIAAQGASVVSYITHILVTNSHATVGTFVNITDGSGGTVLYTGYAAALGGGFSVTLPCPIKTTANTALHAVCVTTGANVRVCASGYKA